MGCTNDKNDTGNNERIHMASSIFGTGENDSMAANRGPPTEIYSGAIAEEFKDVKRIRDRRNSRAFRANERKRGPQKLKKAQEYETNLADVQKVITDKEFVAIVRQMTTVPGQHSGDLGLYNTIVANIS